MSDTAFFIGMGTMIVLALTCIIIMVWHRIKGKDEMDWLLNFKRKKKDQE